MRYVIIFLLFLGYYIKTHDLKGSNLQQTQPVQNRQLELSTVDAAALVMATISNMESASMWAALEDRPYAYHSELKDFDYLRKLEQSNPKEFRIVTTSTARGHFGMTFGAMWDALKIKQRVEWSEESRIWLRDVRNRMIEIEPSLKGVPEMSLELAILYLKNGAVSPMVYRKSSYVNRELMKRLDYMHNTEDYSSFWCDTAKYVEFLYSIWYRDTHDITDKYVITSQQQKRLKLIKRKYLERLGHDGA